MYVSNTVHPPTDTPDVRGMIDVSRYIYEMGTLKKNPRAGWSIPGVPIPETIGSHIFRTAVIGMILAALEGADVGRTVTLCIIHDNHESRIGDIASVARPYVRTAKPELVVQHQTERMPSDVRDIIRNAAQEFESHETREAVIAKDADRLEAIVQGREYEREAGYNTTEWQMSAIASLKTNSAQQIAQSLLDTDPQEWWQFFVKSYNELTALSRTED
ncbi:MAG: HD domain-containing protein [Chloroflexi bacterium]|nr:MAG: HD domain-containing protein [Chloroflexota bacterium]